jgi:hypothetical protein
MISSEEISSASASKVNPILCLRTSFASAFTSSGITNALPFKKA